MYVGRVSHIDGLELQRTLIARRIAEEVKERGVQLTGPDLVAYTACLSGFHTPGDVQRLTALLEKNKK